MTIEKAKSFDLEKLENEVEEESSQLARKYADIF
jgi:hypothetical protein